MKSHSLIIDDSHVLALGNGNYFSWCMEHNGDEWDVATIYGGHFARCKTFEDSLKAIGYSDDRFASYN